MFNMARIPQMTCDRLHKASPDDPASRQIVVLIHNHMFLVDALRNDGTFIGLSLMAHRLSECVNTALSSGEVTPVCILTADDRDSWARVRMPCPWLMYPHRSPESNTSIHSFESKPSSTFMHRFLTILHFTRSYYQHSTQIT